MTGSVLLSGGWDETIFFWDVEKRTLERKIKMDIGPIAEIHCTKSKILSICREDGFQHQLGIIDFGSYLS
jgi:WD40 repeat protein